MLIGEAKKAEEDRKASPFKPLLSSNTQKMKRKDPNTSIYEKGI